MRRTVFLLGLLLLCLLSVAGDAMIRLEGGAGAAGTGGEITVTEVDGAPSGSVSTLKFSNGSVTIPGDGTATIQTGAGGGGDVSSDTATSVIGELTIFKTTGGKTIGRATTSGILFGTAGVLSAAIPGTHYVLPGVDINSSHQVIATHLTAPLPVAQGGTGLASGTSGGVLYYSAAGSIASSALLTQNAPVLGGGAGAAPTVGARSGSTLEFGTISGTKTTNQQLAFDAGGNIIASGTAIAPSTPLALDLGNNASNESTVLTKIATTGDTPTIFTEPTADVLLIDVSKKWPAAGAADTLTGPTTDCAAGTAPLGIDAAGSTVGCFDVATQAELDTHTNATTAHSATSANTPSRIVLRDGSGNFVAGTITATLAGNASTASALATDPNDCSTPNFSRGINASGVAQCFQPAFSEVTGSVTDAQVPNLNALSTGLTPNLCVQTDGSGLLSVAAAACGVGGGGTSVALDLGNNASNESTAVTKIATTGDTNAIFTEPTADVLLIDVTQKWPVANSADFLTGTTVNCTAGNAAAGIDASGNAEGCQPVGDVTAVGSCTTADCFSATTPGATLNFSGSAAPASPPAGTGIQWYDSTLRVLNVKDATGVIKHDVQSKPGEANKFLTAIDDAGAVTNAQPQVSNLSDAATVVRGRTCTPVVTTNTITPDIDTCDVFVLDSIAAPLTIANPTGTITNDRVIDFDFFTSTPRALTWGANFANLYNLALPTTTTGDNQYRDRWRFRWKPTEGKWGLIASTTAVVPGGPGGGAPVDAPYWTSTANATLTAETNLGALTAGTFLLKHTVSAGSSTPANAVAGTDYVIPSALTDMVKNRTCTPTVVSLPPDTITPDVDTCDVFVLDSISAPLTIANPTGTHTNDRQIHFDFFTSTPRALTWGANFDDLYNLALPTTTTGDNQHRDRWSFKWKPTEAKWGLIASTTAVAPGGPGGGAPTDASYWTSTGNATLTNEVSLSALTGLLKVTAGTPAVAVPGTDYTLPASIPTILAADYGVVCDGTTDTTAALQTVLNLRQPAPRTTTGFVITMPKGGRCRLSNTVIVDSVKDLVFLGNDVEFIWTGTVVPMFVCRDCQATTWQGFRVVTTSSAPVSTVMVFENGANTSVTPTRNTVRAVAIECTNGGCTNGMVMAQGAGGDANNDFNAFIDMLVSNYTGSCFRIEHAQSKSNLFKHVGCGSNGLGQHWLRVQPRGSFICEECSGGNHLAADFYVESGTDFSTIRDSNFEGSAALLDTSGPSGAPFVFNIENVRWDSTNLRADNKMISFQYRGPLRVKGLVVEQGPTPKPLDFFFNPGAGIGSFVFEGNAFSSTLADPFTSVRPTVQVSNMRFDGSAWVKLADRIMTVSPAAQSLSTGAVIAADACGGTKLLTATGAVTTDTTNTFDAPNVLTSGCKMEVCNTSTFAITLDQNANFRTTSGNNVVLAASTASSMQCTNVRQTGTEWVELGQQHSFADLAGVATDAQIPDLNVLSTGLAVSRCVETDASGKLTVAAGTCGVSTGSVTVSGTPVAGQAAEWTSPSAITGVGVTGTGNYVKATSPTLVTPNLGTPSAATLTNATGLPMTAITASTSAQLAGVLTDEQGTGVAVFNTNATLVTPTIASFTNATHTHTNAAGGGQLTDAALSAAVTVPKGGTGLTVGTSGGVPYFSAATTMASSAVLTANVPVLGGGAGAAPVSGSRSGNTTSFATTTGTVTGGTNCAQWDTNGNLTAAGAPCGSGGGGVTTDTAQRAAFYNTTTTVDGAPGLTFAADGTTINSTAQRITSTTASETLDINDGPVINCAPATASDVTITLPSIAAASVQRRFSVIKTNATTTFGQCLVDGNGSETINGSTSTMAAATQFSRVDCDVDKTTATANWSCVAGKTNVELGDLTPATAGSRFLGRDNTGAGAWQELTPSAVFTFGATSVGLTTSSKVWLPAVGCTGTTGSLLWDTLATNAPTATCSAGTTETTLMRGVADFPDSDGDYSLQVTASLPSDWTGAIDAVVKYRTTTTNTGLNTVWQLATVCRAAGEVDDATFNTASTVTDAGLGTANQLNNASVANITTTGCAAGELIHLKLLRNRTHASDTMTGVVSLVGVEVTLRRQQ